MLTASFMYFRYFYSVIDNLNNFLFPEKLREDYQLFYFPLSPCGERAVKLEFLDPCSKFVVHKNLFILHNDSERKVPLGQVMKQSVRVVSTWSKATNW